MRAQNNKKGEGIMKKQLIFVFFLSIFLGAGAFFTSLQAGEIIYLEGNVQVKPATEEGWKTAEKGMKVNIGDSIRTARHSLADVALDEEKKNTIRIDPKTTIILGSNNAGTIDKLDISRGRVYSKLENLKAGLTFEVDTPSAVAGVRGSSYSVNSERDEDEIKAYKDEVFIKAYDANKNLITEATLPEGFKTFIDRFEGPGALISISTREFEHFDSVAEELTEHEAGKEKTRQERESAARAAREEQQKTKEEHKSQLEQTTEQVGAEQTATEAVSGTKEIIEEHNSEKNIEENREAPETQEESYHY